MSAIVLSPPAPRFHRFRSHARLDRPLSCLPVLFCSPLSSRRLVLARCSAQPQYQHFVDRLGRFLESVQFRFKTLDPKLAAVLVLVAYSSAGLISRRAIQNAQAPFFCSVSSEQPVIRAQIQVAIKQTPVEMSTAESDISSWLDDLKEEAIQRGVGKDTVLEALEGVKPSPKVMEKDETQPEKTFTAQDYINTLVSKNRISSGVEAFLENRALLEEVSAEYGVPPSIMVAIWGIESNYGSYTGSWNVIQALVTLAFNSPEARRRAFFRDEVFHALFILDKAEGPSSAAGMKGSWAGAMGQCQFMPSSFRNYAVDYDKDGRKDIWTSKADIFASIANYLVQHGWEVGGKYAHKVKVPEDMDKSLCHLDLKKDVNRWIDENDISSYDGRELCGDEPTSLVAPDGLSGPTYLVWENFRVVMRYNISTLYSLAVYELAHEISTRIPAA